MGTAPRKVVFSEFYIKNLKPGPAPYLRWDAKQAGFAVRVELSGYKSWKAIYKFGGRKRDYHIGAVAAVGIADARAEQRGKLIKAREHDPEDQGDTSKIAFGYLNRFSAEMKDAKHGDHRNNMLTRCALHMGRMIPKYTPFTSQPENPWG